MLALNLALPSDVSSEGTVRARANTITNASRRILQGSHHLAWANRVVVSFVLRAWLKRASSNRIVVSSFRADVSTRNPYQKESSPDWSALRRIASSWGSSNELLSLRRRHPGGFLAFVPVGLCRYGAR